MVVLIPYQIDTLRIWRPLNVAVAKEPLTIRLRFLKNRLHLRDRLDISSTPVDNLQNTISYDRYFLSIRGNLRFGEITSQQRRRPLIYFRTIFELFANRIKKRPARYGIKPRRMKIYDVGRFVSYVTVQEERRS